ncbi:hypothetical protein [Novosphingobium lindaniclasticum]|uniref:hypothetical protein n=1 Tax=Novosphingobium lindaniclasticum TaxID=1329895 RepID=UPI0012681319|nr:hypothetical protein [Novosphingobium lindaniclasticum]
MPWGFSALNSGSRRVVDSEKSAYAYVGKVTPAFVPGSGIGNPQATFACVGRPLLYYELNASAAMGIHRLDEVSPNTWRVLALGSNPIRIFGRVDLNWPEGTSANWAVRLRRVSDKKVTFDSGLRMLKLAGWTAYTNLELVMDPSDPENLLPVTPPLDPNGRSINWQPNLIKWSYNSVSIGGGQSTASTMFQKPSWRINGATLVNSWTAFATRTGPGSGNMNVRRYVGGNVSAPITMIDNSAFP